MYRERFVEALKKEIDLKKDLTKGVATVYFGGGTPSVLGVEVLGELLEYVRMRFAVREGAEVTVEVNPDDITPAYAAGLQGAGFNRISMGVQSFADSHLAWMNRRHKAAEAIEAYRILQNAGFGNISLDLIFGYELLSHAVWQENLEQMTALAPQHISAYQMSVEPGSCLSLLLRRGEYTLPPDEICETQYRMLQEHLSACGYQQYEVSNFSLPGFRSRHNSAYWDRTPYLGFGPSAHSFDGTRRFWNTGSIKHYCDFYLSGNASLCEDTSDCFAPERLPAAAGGFEVLSETDVFHEELMLGLRTLDGLELTRLHPGLLHEAMPHLHRQIACGNLILEGDILRIPPEKLFVSDSIIRDSL